MGILKTLGKAGSGILSGTGKATMGAASGLGKATMSIGREVGRGLSKDLTKTAIAVGAGAAIGGVLADADGNAPIGKTAAIGAGIGALSTAIPGGASVVGAIGAGGVALTASAGEAVGSIGKHMIKMPKGPLTLDNLNEIKMTGLGKGLLTGAALLGGVRDGYRYFEKSRMGTNDGMLRTATPTVPIQKQQPSYTNNGGATGDLVFALNNLRNG